MKGETILLLPGDWISVHSPGLLGRLIRWCEQRLPGDRKAPFASHTAIYFGNGIVVEAVGRMRLAPLTEYTGKGIPIRVYRNTRLTATDRQRYIDALMSQWGGRYGYGKILLFALDSLFHTYLFTRTFGVTSFKVCSEYAAWGWQKAFGKQFAGVDWRIVSPDFADDWLSEEEAGWKRIGQDGTAAALDAEVKQHGRLP